MKCPSVETKLSLDECFRKGHPILTEGAVGLRMRYEYAAEPDEYIANAGPLYDPGHRSSLRSIYQQYMDISFRFGLPMIVSTPTRRANRERIAASRYHNQAVNQDCVSFLKDIRSTYPLREHGIYIAGLMGCKGDAYLASEPLNAADSFEFHSWQARQFKEAGADCLMAGIMPTLPEAEGMARAMAATGLPYLISFMIQENGLLIDGTPISEAVRNIDCATVRRPLCYMANCVHPSVLMKALSHRFNRTPWMETRFCGIQANASSLAPEALEGCKASVGDTPEKLARDLQLLRKAFGVRIIGGCCGTDHRHLEAVAMALSEEREGSRIPSGQGL